MLKMLFAAAALLIGCQATFAQDQFFETVPTRFASVNGVSIAYQEIGDPAGPPVILIMGLGSQLTYWGDPLIGILAKQGYRLILVDNRDSGLSSCLTSLGQPTLWWRWLRARAGFPVKGPYGLGEMAADVLGLMDHLKIDSAHVVGASMGGMIAQLIAIRAPNRVRSLVSIMSTTGESGLPVGNLGNDLPGEDTPRAEAVGKTVTIFRALSNDDVAFDADFTRALMEKSFDRQRCPSGIGRQLAAILAAPDRTEALRSLRMPALVLHGERDPLLPPIHGEHTAAAIPAAKFATIPGMGHAIQPVIAPLLAEPLVAFIDAMEKRGGN
jgi:pimeloyl-ACP methyl ester carboxylesterase